MASSVLVGLIATVATLAQGVALAELLAGAFASRGQRWPSWALALLLGGVGLRAAAALLGEPLAQRSASRATAAMRAKLLAALAEQGAGEAQRAATVALLTRGVDAVNLYLTRYLPALVLSALAPVVVLGWIVLADPMSGLIVAATVLVLPVFMVLLGREAAERMGAAWASSARLAGHFGDVLSGMADLRAFNREQAQVEVLDAVGGELRRSTMATLRVALLSSFTLELLASLATALVALSLGIRLIGGHVGLATALAVLVVTPEVYLPLRRASAQFHEATDGVGASTELLARLEEVEASHGQAVAPARPAVNFVAARLPAERGGGELDLTLQHGEHLQLLGASGSGKSSVLQLLLANAELADGHLGIGGVALGDLDRVAWRRRIAWLPQHPTFPGGSVLDAITIRDPLTSRAALLALLERLGLADVAGQAGWLDRPAHEAMAELSSGQRHRVALARCLLGEADLLLLDEPFAYLDGPTAQLVADEIERSWVDRSAVVALHEPSDLLRFDANVELRAGGRRTGGIRASS